MTTKAERAAASAERQQARAAAAAPAVAVPTETPEVTTQQKIDQYIQLRDYKTAADKEFKESMTRVNEAMKKLEGELMLALDSKGATSQQGASGTVYIRTQTSASVKDRNEFLKFVFASKNLELLDVRANKKIVRELGEQGTAVPGVNYTEMKQIGVRRGKES